MIIRKRVIFLENIINKIIELDEQAKRKIKTIKEKEENIEIYINEKLKIEKEKIDNKFLYKKRKIQKKYDLNFEQSKLKIDEYKKKQITELQKIYEQEKQDIMQKIVESIIFKEN